MTKPSSLSFAPSSDRREVNRRPRRPSLKAIFKAARVAGYRQVQVKPDGTIIIDALSETPPPTEPVEVASLKSLLK